MIATATEAVLSVSQSPELSLLVKGTVILGLGLLVARTARSASASVRHLMLAATFCAQLALPLAAIGVPAVTVSVTVDALDARDPSDSVAPTGRAARTAPPKTGDEAAVAPLSVPWTVLGRAAWVIGATVFLIQLAFVLWRLGRLRRTGLPWPDIQPAIRSLAADAGVEGPVDILLHEEVLAPITFGTRGPVIMLPVDARAWDQSDLRRALMHELEHVRRRDWVLQTMARAVCAVWWFHPLVWVAWRHLSLDAERACDDAVMVREENMDYAEQLVSLAERLLATQAQPTLGMANRSDLASRVSSLLDQSRPRGRAGVSAVMIATVAGCVMVLGLAPLRAVVRPSTVSLATTVDASTEASPEQRAAPMSGAGQQGRAQRGLDRELYEAALDADLAGMSELLRVGADVNGSIAGDGSPLIGAVRSGQATAVILLLDRGANPNLGVDGDGSPVIVAAQSGRIEMVRLLLGRGADPNIGVEGDGNPLIAASAAGHLPIVTLLLDHGANVDLVVPGDENALIQASAAGHLAVTQALVERGADVNVRVWAEGNRSTGEWRTPLNMARQGGHADVVKFLLSAGARE